MRTSVHRQHGVGMCHDVGKHVSEWADSSTVRMDGSGVRSGTAIHPSVKGVSVVLFGLPSTSFYEPAGKEYLFISPALPSGRLSA